MNVLNKTKKAIRKYSPIALAGLASVGVVATAVLSAKAAPTAVKLVEEAKKENPEKELTKKEELVLECKAAWKCYIPTAAVGALTIACIIGSNVLSYHQQAAIIGAYAIMQKSYKDYKNKVKELFGEETHEAVMNAIAKEKCEDVTVSATGGFYSSTLDFGEETEPEILRTFYDPISERYFETSISKVIQAEYHLNRNFMLGGTVSVNDFYEFLSLSKTEEGSKLGWSSVDGDIYWIDFNHYINRLGDGMEVHVIEPVFDPVLGWDYDI